ncbi:Bug family tripartite tricarboxylate transporter substrate binding protein [Caldimonas tepidiphila]|uniref:Bug family tripartite tricarboxylate transporter substrate binding protein n=1 Tax=Caldimonas tepidiphila TaxID=2315841 RepID=UPI001F0CD4FD|nr:tripartite tricarboxylate transporter substrate binding protein [Caldimonas tepidiphila]
MLNIDTELDEDRSMKTPKKPVGRPIRLQAIAALALCLGVQAAGAAFPEKPIRLIVPFGPGTSTDTVARAFAEELSKTIGQTVIVDNKAGAGGTVGTAQAAAASADGHTIVLGTVGTHAINTTLYKKLAYNPQRDFTPLAYLGATPTLLVVPANSPVRSLADLKAAGARNAGVLFASAGNGTSGHLAGELLGLRMSMPVTHVPYKEGGQALTETMGGQTAFMFYHPAAVLPHIKSGKLRALGVSSRSRISAAPDVPSLLEQGVKDFDLVAWFMLFAPSQTPAPVVERLQEASARALANADLKARLLGQGVELRPMSVTEMKDFVAQETTKWAEAVRQSGAQLD